MISDTILNSLMTIIFGFFLGILFFGGLRWTVKLITESKLGFLILPLSFIIRSLITIFGFWWISGGSPYMICLSLLGWIAARFLFLHFDKSSPRSSSIATPDGIL